MEQQEANKKSTINLSHPDPTMDTDYRPTSYGSTDRDRYEPVDNPAHSKEVHQHNQRPYFGLFLMLVSHFVIMFAVMYTMVDQWKDVFINLNQFYMTMMMVLPMTLGMLIFMKSMYPDKRLNFLISGISIIGFVAFFYFMRAQSFVGNEQFLKSMIPHHSGAILMCENAQITDPKIIKFCEVIIKTQKDEIATMEEMLKQYK